MPFSRRMNPKLVKPASAAAQALGWVDDKTRAVSPPLHTATTYLRDPDNQYRSGRAYIRADNPAFDQAEALLNHLELGAGAMLFSSGMAAATAVFMALKPGDHVVAPKVMYWGLRNWLQGFAKDWGLDVELVDTTDQAALARAMRPGKTKLVWIETPANPTWVITDISAAAEIAHRAGFQDPSIVRPQGFCSTAAWTPSTSNPPAPPPRPSAGSTIRHAPSPPPSTPRRPIFGTRTTCIARAAATSGPTILPSTRSRHS